MEQDWQQQVLDSQLEVKTSGFAEVPAVSD
jgi:hypothetical protein